MPQFDRWWLTLARWLFGSHRQQRRSLWRLGVRIAVLTCLTLVVWGAAQVQLASQHALASGTVFSITLPLIMKLEAAEDIPLASPEVAATDTPTTTPTETPTNTPSATPTVSPNPLPTISPECEAKVEQNLDGRLRSDRVGEITNISAECAYPVGLASYKMYDDKLSHQTLFSSQVAVIGPGETLTLTIDLPDCVYQVDLFYGPLLVSFDPQHGHYYGKRILASRVVKGSGFCPPTSTTATSTPTSTTTPIGSPTPTSTPTVTPDLGS